MKLLELKLLPKIAVTFGQVRIHKIPRLGIDYPHIFLRLEDSGIIKGCRSDRSYCCIGAVSTKQRSSAFWTKSTIQRVATCCNGRIFPIVTAYCKGGSRHEHKGQIRRACCFLTRSAMAVYATTASAEISYRTEPQRQPPVMGSFIFFFIRDND